MLKPLVDSLPVDRLAIPVLVHDVFVPYFVPGDGAQTIGSPTPDKSGFGTMIVWPMDLLQKN